MAKYSEDYEHRQYGPGSKYPYIVEQPDPVDPEFDLVLGKRVYKVVSSVSPDSKAACKDVYIFSEDEKGIEAEKRSAKWEANLLRKARHQHVVKLIMTYFKKNDRGELAFSIIMDRAEGNLRDRINKGDIQMRWFGCLINVVAYIHKIGIWHRDIKPENILVRKGEVLLADFGISKISTGRPVSKMKDSSQTPTGTANYLAPEVMGGTSTGGLPAEIFSLGAVFFEMAASWYLEGEKKMALRGITFNTGNSFAKSLQQVHDLMGEIIQRLSPESRDPRANISSVTIIDLCQKMLDVEPYKRPTAHDLCLWWNYHCRDSESTRCTCNNSNYAEPPDLDLSSTSLRRAYEAGHILMSQLLRDQNTQLEEGATLVAASKGGLWDVANYAAGITRNVRVVDESGRIALHYLASGDSQQCQSIAKKVLETDADLILRDDSSGKTPLRIAAESGNPNMIWELLKLKANRIQIEGRSPGDMVSEFLHRSSSVGRETHDHYRCEVLSGLLSSSPDFGTRLEDANALSQKATVYACKDILRLLETNGPINDLDSRGQTPLSIAAMYGHTAIVRLLLHMKVNINIEDINGRSPLSIAAIYGHEAIVRLLLERHTTNEADAAINKTDKSGRTLLSKVVDRGNPAIVKLLLDNRADITVVDNNGQTAMSRATLHGNNAIVTLLLDEDADLASGDPKTHKALIEMAAKQGHWVVETLLRTHTGLALTSPKPDESMVIEKAKGLIQQWKTFFRMISVFIVGRIIIVRRISKFFPEDWMMLLRMAGLFIMGGILSSSMMLYGIRDHLQLWDLTSNQTERI